MAKKRQKGDTALRDRAAAALDATNYERFDARGPRTYLCRQRLAAWLDHAGPRPAHCRGGESGHGHGVFR